MIWIALWFAASAPASMAFGHFAHAGMDGLHVVVDTDQHQG